MKPLTPFAVVCLFAMPACTPSFDVETCDRGVKIGDCAPEIEGRNLDGEEVSLSDFGDVAVIAVFGEMWCPLCQILATDLEPLWQSHHDQGLSVVMVLDQDFNGDSASPDEAQAFVDELELTFPVIVTDEGLSDDYEYGLQRPRSFVLDGGRVIRHRTSGYRPGTFDDLRAEALGLLPE